jgi:hypothetical protein
LLLSVAGRVLIANLAGDRRPATLLRSTLKDLAFPVRMLETPLEFTIDRCDTVVVFAGPNLNHDDICLVRAAIDSEAVLLTITTSRPPAPLDQADAAIRVRANDQPRRVWAPRSDRPLHLGSDRAHRSWRGARPADAAAS